MLKNCYQTLTYIRINLVGLQKFKKPMEANINSANIQLQNAYQQINFYQGRNRSSRNVITYSNGPAELAGIFAQSPGPQMSTNRTKQRQKEEVFMCAQPFYVGEVDHNIQEIGIMAVKEVRYVDDEEWQQMLRENQKYVQALQKQKLNQLKQKRKINAHNRVRNQKGQFICKNKNKQQKQKVERSKVQVKKQKGKSKKSYKKDQLNQSYSL